MQRAILYTLAARPGGDVLVDSRGSRAWCRILAEGAEATAQDHRRTGNGVLTMPGEGVIFAAVFCGTLLLGEAIRAVLAAI